MSLLFSLSNELYYSLISFSKMVKFSVLHGSRQCNSNSLLLLSLTLLLLETAEFALLQAFATRAKHTKKRINLHRLINFLIFIQT